MHVSPNLQIHPLATGQVSWQGGFWGRRFDLCRSTALPAMENILSTTPNGASFGNFAKTAGTVKGEHQGTKWSDGDCYKWMEALAAIFEITGDPDIPPKLDRHIADIAAAQAADGYISTWVQLTGRERWSDVHDHELYNMGHLLTAATIHYRATGAENFLEVACRVADYLHGVFMPRPANLAHFGFNPSQIMGCIDLYRATANQRHLELATVFVDMRGSRPGGSDLNQTYMPLRKETTAVGHAVTSGYLYCGGADLLAETCDPELQQALTRIWNNLVETKQYVTGGTAALHFGFSQRPELFNNPNAADGPRPRRTHVHEAHGLEFQLPNATAYNETCANIAHAMWALRMLRLTGDARYADNMELVLYNNLLSGMSLDGLKFCYTNPLRWHGEEHTLLSQDHPERWDDFHCYCCPPNVLRTLASLHNWAYGRSEDALWVLLYGSSEVATRFAPDQPVRIRQETEYPWDAEIRFEVQEADNVPFGLHLRIPAWARDASLSVNSEPESEPQPGTFCTVQRVWNTGDEVVLHIPLPVRRLRANAKVEEARNHTAIARGPVVYCAESADLPEGTALADVHLSRSSRFKPVRKHAELADLVTLQVDAYRLRERPLGLYGEVETATPVDIGLTLIPYYAWNNRGAGAMSVWLPLFS